VHLLCREVRSGVRPGDGREVVQGAEGESGGVSDWPNRILAAFAAVITALLIAVIIWTALGYPH
jgi:hypothetical protein